ncbi:hypothetical protein DNHGIG_20920 [Collibacillus ludicampi]|uniref:Uncharacterized protein n=1 Tax=Collibacillus ludicampi TaxID=2771369 RepID=A0AAV4LFW4_9BACL|nr:hypothetical protein DNHGIG_20920 [Collibacillus ludicampi]
MLLRIERPETVAPRAMAKNVPMLYPAYVPIIPVFDDVAFRL